MAGTNDKRTPEGRSLKEPASGGFPAFMKNVNDAKMTHEHSHHGDGSDGSPFANSHILTHEVDYVRVASLEEAAALLEERANAQVLAGGTNLLVDLKMATDAELVEEPKVLVDISRITELRGIEKTAAGVRIGALTSIRALVLSAILWSDYTALAEAAAAFGSTQVMMMGTLGGNIANGSPASDTVPALGCARRTGRDCRSKWEKNSAGC